MRSRSRSKRIESVHKGKIEGAGDVPHRVFRRLPVVHRVRPRALVHPPLTLVAAGGACLGVECEKIAAGEHRGGRKRLQNGDAPINLSVNVVGQILRDLLQSLFDLRAL